MVEYRGRESMEGKGEGGLQYGGKLGKTDMTNVNAF